MLFVKARLCKFCKDNIHLIVIINIKRNGWISHRLKDTRRMMGVRERERGVSDDDDDEHPQSSV